MKGTVTGVFAPVGGEVDWPSLEQLRTCMQDERAVAGALMADHHLGYSMPIGGVIAYDGAVSPSAVGFDIGCGNMAVRTEAHITEADSYDAIRKVMREVQRRVAFGLGRTSEEEVHHTLFLNPLWDEIEQLSPGLKDKARAQLGTVGSGNHYVDLLVDEDGYVWVANHFGSRGFGHTIASGFLNLGAGKGWSEKVIEQDEATLLSTDSYVGELYLACMRLAGEYAYAGREHVIGQVLEVLGNPRVTMSVHNHHNFAWEESGLFVHRKGATPLTSEPAFIGGSMGDISVIVRGMVPSDRMAVLCSTQGTVAELERTLFDIGNLGSAPHGAGRQLSRTQAAGKFRKMWYCNNRNCSFPPERKSGPNTAYDRNHCPLCQLPLRSGRLRDATGAAIDWNAVRDELAARGIVVLGAGADEAPGAYKSLESVLAAHTNVEIMHRLNPIGVVMAGSDTYDPYKD